MCMAEVNTPKWYGLAAGTIRHKSLAMMSGVIIPIGIYRRFSDETFGIKT